MDAGASERVVAGRYRIEAALGSGGMGQVWRATDLVLGRVVALKRIRIVPGLSAGEVELARARTLREARIAAALDHATAVRIFDVLGGDGTDPVLVLEYVPSRELGTVSGLRHHDIARIGADVASALAAAHAAGIVHRDVKPANVLLLDRPRDGVVAKLTDFGISHAVDGPELTHTGTVSGTPAYFAPELARGHVGGPPADVYSLGATLFAAVSGAPPFGRGDGNVFVLLARIAGGGAPRLPDGPLSALVAAMTADDPGARPTAAEARDALRRIATSPTPAFPDTPFPQPPFTQSQPPFPQSQPPFPPVPSPRGADHTWVDAPRPLAATAAPARRGRRRLLAVAVGAAAAVALTVAGGLAGATLSDVGSSPTRLAQRPPTGIADAATADPCDLVSVESLRPFGNPTIRNGGTFSGCTVDIRGGAGGATIVLQVVFSEGSRSGGTTEDRPGGSITRFPEGESSCERRLQLAGGTALIVLASSPGEDCPVADSAAETVLRIVERRSPDERAPLEGTTLLGGIDACSLLGDADLVEYIPTDRGPRPDFQGWSCVWGSGTERVILQYERLRLSTSPTTTAGRRPATVRDSTNYCEAQILVDGPETSVLEAVAVFTYGSRPGSDRCTEALTLATAVEGRLPAP